MKKVGYQFILLENNPNNIPYADGYGNDAKKLVIFDDLMSLPNNIEAKITDHYTFGRQKT